MEEGYKSYPFWYLVGTEIINTLHRTKNYLKKWRQISGDCEYDQWTKEFYESEFISEVTSLYEQLLPALKIQKKDDAEILVTLKRKPKVSNGNVGVSKEVTKVSIETYVDLYYFFLDFMQEIKITDLRKAEDDPDADEDAALDS